MSAAVRIGSSQGSGVLVSKDGYVLTAGHVVGKPGQEVSFIFEDGKTVKGKTLGLYKGADAGMMKITDKGEWPFVELGDTPWRGLEERLAGRPVLKVDRLTRPNGDRSRAPPDS